MNGPPVTLHPLPADDLGVLVDLGTRALGWEGEARDRAFVRWKHLDNPFGRSYAIAAFVDGTPIAVRTMLRWRLQREDRGTRSSMDVVRAVDTATHPDFQGQGLFRRLTEHAVAELTAAGVGAVFNTPNAQSRPGYLRMGWTVVGRPTVRLWTTSPAAVVGLLRGGGAANKWSEPVSAGVPAHTVAAELAVAATGRSRSGWSTATDEAYLAWRYGLAALHYRAVEVRGGWCVFRVRERGGQREVVLAEWLSSSPDPAAIRRLVRDVGDYAIGVGLGAGARGLLAVPRQGPRITWRPLADPTTPAIGDLALGMGDLELF